MISGRTAVYGLIGRPVGHSRSPALHNAWFAEAGVDAVYVALEAADPTAVSAAFQLGLAGANLTTPLKHTSLPLLWRVEEAARRIGAANVLVRADKGWLGANTDAEGLCRSLEEVGVEVGGRRVVILGAGGAARAAAVGLASRGADRIEVRARRPEQAEEVAALVGGRAGPLDASAVDGAELVVVATSGRAQAVGRLDPGRAAAGAVWLDLNYWDPDPPGFAEARRVGLRTVNGYGMLWWQAALAFERWTGHLPPVAAR